MEKNEAFIKGNKAKNVMKKLHALGFIDFELNQMTVESHLEGEDGEVEDEEMNEILNVIMVRNAN
jgi:hypothetical protein